MDCKTISDFYLKLPSQQLQRIAIQRCDNCGYWWNTIIQEDEDIIWSTFLGHDLFRCQNVKYTCLHINLWGHLKSFILPFGHYPCFFHQILTFHFYLYVEDL